MQQPVIELSNVRFSWTAASPIVIDIESLRVDSGERIFLRGPSGSGKSTLLSLLAGITVPNEGVVRVLGRDIDKLPGAARDRFRADHIGFIFQMFNLIPYLSVLDNVLLAVRFTPARAARLGGRDARHEATRLLDALGLRSDGFLRRPVTELSIGQQQRVAAARALLGRPGLIVADEPTSALDSDAREEFLALLMHECRAQGSTLLFVSHDTALGARFDRTLSLAGINRAATSG